MSLIYFIDRDFTYDNRIITVSENRTFTVPLFSVTSTPSRRTESVKLRERSYAHSMEVSFIHPSYLCACSDTITGVELRTVVFGETHTTLSLYTLLTRNPGKDTSKFGKI